MSIPNQQDPDGMCTYDLLAAIYRRLGRIMDHLDIDDESTPEDTPFCYSGSEVFKYKNVSIRWYYYVEREDIQNSLKDRIIRTVIEATDNEPFKPSVFKSCIESLNEKMGGKARIISTVIGYEENVTE